MQVFDLKKYQIPNWLVGGIWGGLVYVLLSLIMFIFPFIPFPMGQDLGAMLFWSIEVEREAIGALLGIHPIIAGSIPFLLLGSLFGAVNGIVSRIIILLFLVGLAPFVMAVLFFYYLVAMHPW
jgi:hypothetical protein